MTLTPDLSALCADIKSEFPKFTIVKKSDNWFMRLLGHVMGSQFSTSYVTTIWNTVYVPDDWDNWADANRCSVLRHERVHMRQAAKLTFPIFALAYLLVFFPLGLAYCRARFEMEAYTESLAAFKDYGIDYTSEARRQWLMKQFTTSAYGWMWPFPSAVSKWFDEAVAQVGA